MVVQHHGRRVVTLKYGVRTLLHKSLDRCLGHTSGLRREKNASFRVSGGAQIGLDYLLIKLD